MLMQDAVLKFKICNMFETIGGGTGVLLISQESLVPFAEPILPMMYLSYEKDLDGYRIGSDAQVVEVPIKVGRGHRGTKIVRKNIPAHMVDVGWGPLMKVIQGLRKVYLMNLYLRPLHRAYPGKEKKFDSKSVFADTTLSLIESAYQHFHGSNIHEVLSVDDYQLEALAVYTRFPVEFDPFDDAGEISPFVHNTPRTMHYYPDMNTIRVSWTIGGSPRDVVKYDDPNGDADLHIKSQPFQLKIQKVYQNEGWKSLREVMREDEVLHAFVRQFYMNGYGKPGERNSPQ